MTTIDAGTLTRLIGQTKPHISDRGGPEAHQAIRLESDGTTLYASATNRYTLGVARTRLTADGQPWNVTIPQRNLRDLEAAARILNAKPVTITPRDDSIELADGDGTRILIGHQDIRPGLPDWRLLVLPALDRAPAGQPMAMTPRYFNAWKSLPGPVTVWSTGPMKPTVILAPDFVGLQMPRVADADRLQADIDSWKPVPTADETAVLEAA